MKRVQKKKQKQKKNESKIDDDVKDCARNEKKKNGNNFRLTQKFIIEIKIGMRDTFAISYTLR
jgi:hypothetical protein